MKHILVGLILSMLFTPITVMAEEQSQSTQPTTTNSPSTDKKDTTEPKETTNIVDFCRTHTC